VALIRATSQSSPLSTGPAAVSLSLQLVMPPALLRRHDPSRGEPGGANVLAPTAHGVPELRPPAALQPLSQPA
jgi:hypothetical protein